MAVFNILDSFGMLDRKYETMKEVKSISFRLKSRTKVDGLAGMSYMTEKHLLIVMRVCVNNYKIDLSTGLHVDLADLDEDNQLVKPSCNACEEVNDGMEMMKLIFKDCVRLFNKEGVEPEKSELVGEFRRMTQRICCLFGLAKAKVDTEEGRLKERSELFWNALDKFRRESNVFQGWGKATRAKFHALKTHLDAFVEKKKGENKKFLLTFDFFTKEGLNEYCEFVQDNYKYRTITMKKHLEFLRWFMRWAVRMGYNHNIAFECYRPILRIADRRVIFLAVEELNMIIDLQIPDDDSEENTALLHDRDIFLFMCLTGLRYSDVANLRRCDLSYDGMYVTTVKTTDNLIINLNKYSAAILEKYAHENFIDGKALPVTSNQKLNEHIHKLCRMAGINQSVHIVYYKGKERHDEIKEKWELVSSQIGRKTFVCLALSLGIDRDTIMKWTGHHDYKSMDPNVDIVDNHKQKAMKLFDKLPLVDIEKNDDNPDKK